MTASSLLTSGSPPCTPMPNEYPKGECTWWVQHLYPCLPSTMGNATSWLASARTNGYPVFGSPAVDLVVVWSAAKYGPYGHVAVVTAVTAPSFSVSEMNFYAWDQSDTREVADLSGVEGFFAPPGSTLGEGPQAQPASSNPAAAGGIAAAISKATANAQHGIASGAQMALGAGIMGSGLYVLQRGLRGRPMPNPLRDLGRPKSARRPARPRPAPAPSSPHRPPGRTPAERAFAGEPTTASSGRGPAAPRPPSGPRVDRSEVYTALRAMGFSPSRAYVGAEAGLAAGGPITQQVAAALRALRANGR